MDLLKYGQTLRKFRKSRGLTQAKVAEQIGVIPNLISIWERAYEHNDRQWRPDRSSVVRLVEIFADFLTASTAIAWVAQAEYQLTHQELARFFPSQADPPFYLYTAQDEAKANFQRLQLATEQHLFGIAASQQKISQQLNSPHAPWIVALAGIGGIGKTTLAQSIVEQIMLEDRFYDLAWVSAKQHEYRPSLGLEPDARPALDHETLADTLLYQLAPALILPPSLPEKTAYLSDLLKQHPYLIVIDNLETVVDYESLLPLLRKLTNPAKFLLTSRHALHHFADIFSFNIVELAKADSLQLLQHQAQNRGQSALNEATPAQLNQIYEVVGGHPLAMKLVVGQSYIFSLPQVLANLKEARGKKTADLYTHIYYQAWESLSPTAQKVFLVMPLANGGRLEQLEAVTQLTLDELLPALEHLITLSLIQVGGDLEVRRYHIHRLTETFLLRDIIDWDGPML